MHSSKYGIHIYSLSDCLVVYFSGPIIRRLLFVGNLPSDVAETTLRELFPDALRVIFPRKDAKEENAENSEQTR